MTPEDLKHYLENMRMSHVYQPVMIKRMLMNGGSATLKQTGVMAALESGPYNFLRPGIRKVTDAADRIKVRRAAASADYVVGGINAITMAGEIVNIDGSGNRLRILPFSIFGFIVSLVTISHATILQFIIEPFRKTQNLHWDKTKRYRGQAK